MRNIEIKLCRPDGLTDIRFAELLTKMGATHVWDRHQSDTFWHTQRGWLKLREVTETAVGDPVAAELIGYQRSTGTTDARPSDYHISTIADPESLKAALDSTLGRIETVEKTRALWLWKQTRVHLDEVNHLGAFVELETVLDDIDEQQGHGQLQECLRELQLEGAQRLATPYLEMLLQNRRSQAAGSNA